MVFSRLHLMNTGLLYSFLAKFTEKAMPIVFCPPRKNTDLPISQKFSSVSTVRLKTSDITKNCFCSNFYSCLYCTGDSPIRKVVSHLKTGIQVHLVTLPVWFSRSSGVPRKVHSLTSLNCIQPKGNRV